MSLVSCINLNLPIISGAVVDDKEILQPAHFEVPGAQIQSALSAIPINE